ncbi:MAG: tail fiber domain-containing protein, partial [Phycisphaerales bacterium]
MKRFLAFAASALAGLAAITTSPTQALAQTFTSTQYIDIPDSGVANPYLTQITVSGVAFPITYVSVTLRGLSHANAYDVNVLLVSPSGQKIMLMNQVGGVAGNATLTFVPDETARLSRDFVNIASGVYSCSAYNTSTSLPAPAPAAPYGNSLASLLVGTDANGEWSLYVFDSTDPDGGNIAGGWSITFNDRSFSPANSSFTYQGRVTSGGVPINGDANVRFTLCNDPTAPTATAAVAQAITQGFTNISDGLINAPLNFGVSLDTTQPFWLQLEVESPIGSGFVALSPRQPLTAAPKARVAQKALNATNANHAEAAEFARSATSASSAIFATSAGSATTATTAAQLAAGRARIRGDSGAAFNSPGIWFASPINAPVDRSFIGQRNDDAVGIFNGGWNLLVHSNGNVAIGDQSGTAPSQRLTVSGNVLANNVAVPSSGRFKHNVAPMTDALDRLLQLEGVTFDWNPEFAKDRPGREHDIGFVAEDVAKIFPEVVFYDADGKVTGMDYSRLTAVAVQAIKQQQAKFSAELQAKQRELDD